MTDSPGSRHDRWMAGSTGDIAPAWGEEPDGDGRSLAGDLLVAAPALVDPNFDRTVLLVLDHGPEGALGVILNRPTEVEVAEIIGSWASEARRTPPALVFSGGPVAPNAMIGIGRLAAGPARGAARGGEGPAAGGWRAALGADTVDLSLPPGSQDVAIDGARLFAGYAGWGPGQLEGELEAGGWIVLGAIPADIFCEDPGSLWSDVLRRQGGELSMLANYPPDPTLN